MTSELGGPAPGVGYGSPVSEHALVRLTDVGVEPARATVAAEVPVAFVYNGRSHVVMMSTPADLEDLAVGFTVSEHIVDDAGDIGHLEVVRHSRGIELQMSIATAAADRLAERGRAIAGRTGCGLCGAEAIDDVLRPVNAVLSARTFTRDALFRAGESLGERQRLNADARTLHAAAWADATGDVLVVREDVGRHNAVDKVIGSLLREHTDPSGGFVVVTSRASYELVQKCAVLGVPMLAAVSRPTSLAIRLAEASGIALVGLLRERTANVYAHAERVNA